MSTNSRERRQRRHLRDLRKLHYQQRITSNQCFDPQPIRKHFHVSHTSSDHQFTRTKCHQRFAIPMLVINTLHRQRLSHERLRPTNHFVHRPMGWNHLDPPHIPERSRQHLHQRPLMHRCPVHRNRQRQLRLGNVPRQQRNMVIPNHRLHQPGLRVVSDNNHDNNHDYSTLDELWSSDVGCFAESGVFQFAEQCFMRDC